MALVLIFQSEGRYLRTQVSVLGVCSLLLAPPSHAMASWRWIFAVFRHSFRVLHFPLTQESAGWAFMASRHYSHILHIPRMQRQARGGYLWQFDAILTSSTSFAHKSQLDRPSWCPNAVLASSTSLAHNSERKVDLHGVPTPFLCPPPPSHATASWRWIFMVFRCYSCILHLLSHFTTESLTSQCCMVVRFF